MTGPSTRPTLLEQSAELWVFDKPSGWLTHPAGSDAPNLLSFARDVAGAPAGIAPIHRLDAETSGIVLLSPDPYIRGELGRAFADGSVEKRYLALVHGRTRKKGNIRRPLKDRRRGKPLPAVTRYRTKEWLPRCSLVSVRPGSGRKHQIRRHLHMIGHPIVGDRRYRQARRAPLNGSPGRLWLHAARISLVDGRVFLSRLPDELLQHLERLREESTQQEKKIPPTR